MECIIFIVLIYSYYYVVIYSYYLYMEYITTQYILVYIYIYIYTHCNGVMEYDIIGVWINYT